MPNYTVDVLVPVYNGAATIRSSLASIQSQTLRAIRIIVVNDGSTDATSDIVAALANEDPRIILVNKPNSGIVDTLNFGLARCDAELIARFDADDISYPNRLEVQLSYLDRHLDCVAVGGRVDHIDELGHPLQGLPLPGQPDGANPYWLPAREPYLIHPFLMVRQPAIQDVGGYRYVTNSEDSDLYWRLAERGRLHNLELSLGQYRMHIKSISGASILNGRVMAVNSQRAALSAIRRRAGRPDLTFPRTEGRHSSTTLEELCELASTSLDKQESTHLSMAASAKLLELTNYRPYELEYSDCKFIRQSFGMAHQVSQQNRAELNWLMTVAAARLLAKGSLSEAVALTPPRFYGIAAIRTICKIAGL